MSGSSGRSSVARFLVAVQIFLIVASLFAPMATLAADTGTQMRVNGGDYMYNFSTKTLTAGQDYTIRIRVGSPTGPIIQRALFQPKK